MSSANHFVIFYIFVITLIMIQALSKWLVLGCIIFYKNIKNAYLLVINVLEGIYVNLLIWWFGDNWLLCLGAIAIQMKFDVIMDLLKWRKISRFTPDD